MQAEVMETHTEIIDDWATDEVLGIGPENDEDEDEDEVGSDLEELDEDELDEDDSDEDDSNEE